jgi:hypothetical protein
MRIAQIAPLHERVPPKFYGGTERVVSFLTEELVRQGHDVTEPPRVCRRPVGLSHAAMAGCSSMA